MGSRSLEQRALLTDYDPTTAYSQAFYTLFANIRFQWESEQAILSQQVAETTPVHTLLVTSASAYKDQPTVAANLAIVAAQSGAETILVDANLHSPGIGSRFGLSQTAGLGELLETGDITLETLERYLQPTFVPGLRVLGAGGASAQGTALLLSSHLARVVTGLRNMLAASHKSSGVVIFHSTPVLSSVDAALIGALTEQTVLTIIMGQTTRAQAKRAQEQLQQAHISLGGVIMLHP